MLDTICFPGFSLKPSMYSNVDSLNNSQSIEFNIDQDYLSILDELHTKIPKNHLVVGYSQGARLALAIEAQYPGTFRGMVLISVNAGLNAQEQESRKIQDFENAELAKNDLDSFYKSFDMKDVFSQYSQEQQEYLDSLRINDENIVASQLRNLGLGSMPNYENRLNSISIPVAYISGARDKKYTQLSAKYKKMTPFSNHIVLDSDHRIFLESPNTLSLAIQWFSNQFFNR
ncbi:MAG: hypothetical protein U0R17_06730 [Acidimicrobiia bacterium]